MGVRRTDRPAERASAEQRRGGPDDDRTPYVVAALNGDVDNHADLKAAEGLRIPVEVTTDAKVIPMMVASRVGEGLEPGRRSGGLSRASRDRSRSPRGSPSRPAPCCSPNVAVVRVYVGLAEDAFVVASEPYGLVEETAEYVRLDGETPSDPANPNASRGQVFVLDGDLAGSLDGITRLSTTAR